MWIDCLKKKTKENENRCIRELKYEDIREEIEYVASIGRNFTFFDIDKISTTSKEKLRKEHLIVEDVKEIGKVKISW